MSTTSSMNDGASPQMASPQTTSSRPQGSNPALMNFDRFGFEVTEEPPLRRAAPWIAAVCGGLFIGLIVTQVFSGSNAEAPSPATPAVLVIR